MGIYIYSTSLQATVVDEIIELENDKYSVVIGEINKKSTNRRCVIFDKVRSKSWFYIEFDSNAPVFLKVLRYFAIFFMASIFYSKVFYSNIINYNFYFCVRFFPWLKIFTYDEGGFNVNRDGPFHLAALGLYHNKKSCIAIDYFLKRSIGHYTIFDAPISNNQVLSGMGCFLVCIDWSKYLNVEEKGYLDGLVVNSVLVGTAFQNHMNGDYCLDLAEIYFNKVDVFIDHPANQCKFWDKPVFNFFSPAEAIIGYLSSKPIVVYHFSSTVSFNLRGLKNVVFENLDR